MILFKSKSMRLSVSIASVLLLMSFVFSNKVSITAHDISAQQEIVPTKPEPLFTDAEHDFVQVGEASWYGAEFHNRPTASGEMFDMNGLTAAHKTLPFGSLVVVTNNVTGNSVLVKINDRGPFVRKRIIDLSQKAASILGGSLFKIQIEAYTPGSFASTDENDKVLVFSDKSEALLVNNSSTRDIETHANFGVAMARLSQLSKANEHKKYSLKPMWQDNGSRDVVRYVITTIETSQPTLPELF